MQVSAAEHGIFVSAHPRYESLPSKEKDALICVRASAGTAAVGANTNIHAKDCKDGVYLICKQPPAANEKLHPQPPE